jgi:integrase
MQGMKPPHLPEEQVPALSDDQLRRLLIDTGLRRSECVGIAQDDLDLDDRWSWCSARAAGLASSPSAARRPWRWTGTCGSG